MDLTVQRLVVAHDGQNGKVDRSKEYYYGRLDPPLFVDYSVELCRSGTDSLHRCEARTLIPLQGSQHQKMASKVNNETNHPIVHGEDRRNESAEGEAQFPINDPDVCPPSFVSFLLLVVVDTHTCVPRMMWMRAFSLLLSAARTAAASPRFVLFVCFFVFVLRRPLLFFVLF